MPSPIHRQQRAQAVGLGLVRGASPLVDAACADQASGRTLDTEDSPVDHHAPLQLHSSSHGQVWSLTSPDSAGQWVTDWYRICDRHGLAQEFVSEIDACRTRCPQCEVDEYAAPWRNGFRLVQMFTRVVSTR